MIIEECKWKYYIKDYTMTGRISTSAIWDITSWLDENNIDYYHKYFYNVTKTGDDYSLWKFTCKENAMAFKLRWM